MELRNSLRRRRGVKKFKFKKKLRKCVELEKFLLIIYVFDLIIKIIISFINYIIFVGVVYEKLINYDW